MSDDLILSLKKEQLLKGKNVIYMKSKTFEKTDKMKKEDAKNRKLGLMSSDKIIRKLLFCPKCNAFHIIENIVTIKNSIDTKENDQEEHVDEINVNEGTLYSTYYSSVQCSNCKTIFSNKDFHFIGISSFKECITSYPISYFLFDNKNGSVSLKMNELQVQGFNDKIQTRSVQHKIIINYITGQSYMLAPKCQKRSLKKYYIKNICNISYGQTPVLNYFINNNQINEMLFDFIHSKISKRLGYTPPTLREYDEQYAKQRYKKEKSKIIPTTCFGHRYNKLQYIVLYNRLPNINTYQLSTVITYNLKLKNIFKKIKNNNDSPLRTAIEIAKIPYNKTIRKILLEELNLLIVLKDLYSLFKDINTIKNIVSNAVLKSSFAFESNKVLKNFLKVLIKKYGEQKTYQKISRIKKGSYGHLRDTANMYFKIKEYNKTRKRKIDLDLTGNISEIHDRFSQSMIKINSKNHYFRYSKEDKDKIYYSKNGYKLKLTKTTHQLKEIGNLMHICVGSYDNSALNKECRIATLTKNNKYITCIELDYELTTVKQTKMHYNKRPDGEVRELLLDWIQEKDLIIDSYDINLDENKTQAV